MHDEPQKCFHKLFGPQNSLPSSKKTLEHAMFLLCFWLFLHSQSYASRSQIKNLGVQCDRRSVQNAWCTDWCHSNSMINYDKVMQTPSQVEQHYTSNWWIPADLPCDLPWFYWEFTLFYWDLSWFSLLGTDLQHTFNSIESSNRC